MNRAEDAGEQRRVLRVLLEFDEFPIQTGQVFMTFDQELANYFLILHAHFLQRAY